MASRNPITIIGNLQLTTALTDSSYTVPANSSVTISAVELNNTTAVPQSVTIHLIPTGGSATAANQIVTTLVVGAAGAAPTLVPALVGQHILAGGKLQMLSSLAASITPLVSGYLNT
jgi:predicted phage tail protein